MERDAFRVAAVLVSDDFNPRAPHGARPRGRLTIRSRIRFQSTRSAWSATFRTQWPSKKRRYFNPRAPHGARPGAYSGPLPGALFQSTRSAWSATAQKVPMANGNLFQSTRSAWSATAPDDGCLFGLALFQSTRSAWSATPPRIRLLRVSAISIHALRMERDMGGIYKIAVCVDFNPRAPHGARLPARSKLSSAKRISIHALRMERDLRRL